MTFKKMGMLVIFSSLIFIGIVFFCFWNMGTSKMQESFLFDKYSVEIVNALLAGKGVENVHVVSDLHLKEELISSLIKYRDEERTTAPPEPSVVGYYITIVSPYGKHDLFYFNNIRHTLDDKVLSDSESSNLEALIEKSIRNLHKD